MPILNNSLDITTALEHRNAPIASRLPAFTHTTIDPACLSVNVTPTADMAATLDGQHTPAKPVAIRSAGMKLDPPQIQNLKIANASVDIMSPVNQNGCFEFDRIIKAGTVVKRTRKTKARMHARCRQARHDVY